MNKMKIGALFLALSLGVSTFSACDFVNGLLNGGNSASENSSVTSESTLENSEAHEHVFSKDWKHNSSYHWHVCECGEQADKFKHEGGEASCTEKATCSVCGREYGKITGHTYGALTDIEEGVKGYACDCGENIPLLTTENEQGFREGGLIDFVVEVEEGKDPVILQLTDTQFTDSNMEARCFQYVRETVEATNPDLIMITGDLVYGRFDMQGTLFTNFIAFMESLQIPWAPVFGNHDNECWLGVDWQCEQLEAAEYCLFEQGNVTGNGNYTVGIMQGNELLRVFYMMDSNGCGAPMVSGDGNNTVTNPNQPLGKNKVKTSAGFGDDQVGWFTASMLQVKEISPETKLSVAYHIQQAYFLKAYTQYGYVGQLQSGSNSALKYALDFDAAKMINTETGAVEKVLEVKEGDIGYLGRTMKGPWDGTFSVFAGMKNLGVDSLFCGHEHCNSASVVYDGVRFQFGQKSSTYDRYNSLNSAGQILGGYQSYGTPLIGGTAFSLSQEDGAIISPYIYLAGDPLGTNPKK